MKINFHGNYTIYTKSPQEAKTIQENLSQRRITEAYIQENNEVRYLTGQDYIDYINLLEASFKLINYENSGNERYHKVKQTIRSKFDEKAQKINTLD